MTLYRILVLLLLLSSCRNEASKSLEKGAEGIASTLKYAEGFSVAYFKNYKVITVSRPWPDAKKKYQYVILNEGYIAEKLSNESFDAVIESNVNDIVVTSTTHIPHLELLEAEETLVGFPGTDYISSDKTRALISNGQVRELGKNESINTEVLLDINPDVVVGFGVESVNKAFETIKKAGIPVIYNGDWVESSPLAKAEWIKFFGVLFNKEKKADSIFNRIEKNYLEAKALAKEAKYRPTVLSGAMHKDVWYLPNGASPEAQFIKDANANYLWADTNGNGSLALSFEIVYDKAKTADLWLSPSYYTSLNQLKEASSLYTNFEAYKEQAVFSFSGTVGKTGGVLYYEIGTARPDLVLKDIIKVCHPELLEDYQTSFFKQLK